ncbi:MAG: cupin domain-containing protein [Armatimonas sp.]
MKQTFKHLGENISGTCLIGSAETLGAFSFFHIETQLGANVPPHVHQNEDEVLYILEGTYRLQLGSRLFTAAKGEVIYLPRTVVHSFECTSEAGGTLLVLTLPGGFEAFFTQLDAFGALPMPPTQEDIERFAAMLGRYGMTPSAPPPKVRW